MSARLVRTGRNGRNHPPEPVTPEGRRRASGDLPLVVLPAPANERPEPLYYASIKARRAVREIEATGRGYELDGVQSRVLVQLQGVAECVGRMAASGLLHTELNAATTLQTHTRLHAGQWVSATTCTRVPPRVLTNVRLSPELCNAAMLGLVVFSIASDDPWGELVEYRELAAMLAGDWPELDGELAGRLGREWGQRRTGGDLRMPLRPMDESPFGRAAHHISNSVARAARSASPPHELELASVHALDYARRTLAWLGESVVEVAEPLDA